MNEKLKTYIHKEVCYQKCPNKRLKIMENETETLLSDLIYWERSLFAYEKKIINLHV